MRQLLHRAVSTTCLLIFFCFAFNTTSFADVTLTSSPIAAANIAQGSANVIAYAVKMDVTVAPVTVNSIQFTLGGTYDNNDLSLVSVYFNATAPAISGATLLANLGAAFAAPHTYSVGLNQTIAAGASGYFIITTSLSPTATAGNTIKLDGAANPVVFGFTAAQTLINNQSNIAGLQTIQAAAVTLTSSAVAASNIAQGTSNVVVYAVKADVTTLPVTINNIQFTLTGTHDNNDLTVVSVYFNATAPTVSGAALLANLGAANAAPHTYSAGLNQTIAAGASGYFIITVSLSATATGGNTIKLDGAVNPVVFGFTTGPAVTNNQTDIAEVQTIIAGAVTLTSQPVAASNIAQGTSNVVVYAVKADVTTLPVTINNIQFTLTGTHDNNDLTLVSVYFNATAPTLSGATLQSNLGGSFAAPHTYNAALNVPFAAGNSGYFLITVSLSVTATGGNTIKLDGAANPVVFGFATGPAVTNNQTDIAGVQTIISGLVTLTSSAVPASNIAQGTANVMVYAMKADVATLPVTINSVQFTLAGTHDNNDLISTTVYFNATAPSLTGASFLASSAATFAAPHTYSVAVSQAIAAGNSGYFIFVVSVSASGTAGNTIKVDGAANPVVLGFTTGPTVNSNQTDIAGIQTILAAGVTLTSSAVPASNIAQGTNNNVVYAVKMDVTNLPVTVNNVQFTLTGTHDNNDLTVVSAYFNATAPTLTGATFLNSIGATFAAPHTYNIPNGGQPIAAGGSGYFLITANLDPAATVGNTVILNGAADPVVFGFTTAPPVTNNQTNAAGAQTFSSVLPLTLVSFTGILSNTQQILLQWNTVNELNTKAFEVEWSGDGIQFKNIGVLPAANNSTLQKQYNYVHNNPAAGNNYYRLKMTDNNGLFTYSGVIRIKPAATINAVKIFPNPVTDMLQITLQSDKNTNLMSTLRSADGKLITVKNFALVKGSNSFNWNLHQLKPGTYFIAFGDHAFETVRIIK